MSLENLPPESEPTPDYNDIEFSARKNETSPKLTPERLAEIKQEAAQRELAEEETAKQAEASKQHDRPNPYWPDEKTREVGKKGIEKAREVLRKAVKNRPPSPSD